MNLDRLERQYYRIVTYQPTSGEEVVVVGHPYGTLVAAHPFHPERKGPGPDGLPCRTGTARLLSRRPVIALEKRYVSKESNRLEEVEAGIEHDPDEVYTQYTDAERDPRRRLVLPVLKDILAKPLVEETGLAISTVKVTRNAHAVPRDRNREVLA